MDTVRIVEDVILKACQGIFLKLPYDARLDLRLCDI